jgi:xanthine dehydrogenase large subunit
VFPGDPVLAEGEVAFWGQPLFAVAARSQRLARRAARLAMVRYEPLEACLDIEAALRSKNFIRPSLAFRRGDPAAACEKAPHRLQGEVRIGGQEHFYLEGQVSLAIPAEEGCMTLHTSSQNPTQIQQAVARVLGVPMNHITVEVRRMGGAFGGKETQAAQWACIAALLAHKTGRPVKCRLARVDDMTVTGKRHPFLCRHSMGFDDEGRILGLEMELSANCGFSPDLSDAVVDRAMLHADNGYHLTDVRITGNRCKTNIVSSTAFRGFGAPQAMVAMEGVMDDISRYLGRDPLEVRKINLYAEDGGRHITHYGQAIEQLVLGDIISRLEQTSGYQARREAIIRFNRDNGVFRKGIALTPVKFGISFSAQHLNQAGALLHVYTDGSIHLNHGGTEMGQGLLIKVAQVVAQEFHVPLDKVVVSAARTDKVPNTPPTAASAGSDLNGMAARDAAHKIKARMTAFAATHFDVDESEVYFADNQVHAGTSRLGFAEFVQLCNLQRLSLSATGFYRTPEIQFDRETGKGRPYYYYANGAAVSEVLIDTLTGEYKVSGVDILHDVGHSLNPAIDIGQIEGGFIQGMGWLTTEELVWDDLGRLLTRSPATYKIPTIGDTPAHFKVDLLPDSPNRKASIYHSKGVGEPPFMLAISVWCALRDAIASLAGYRHSPRLDTPATPEKVLRAVRETMSRNHEKLD